MNKAKYANHNRKAMADKKRAKGMIWSFISSILYYYITDMNKFLHLLFLEWRNGLLGRGGMGTTIRLTPQPPPAAKERIMKIIQIALHLHAIKKQSEVLFMMWQVYLFSLEMWIQSIFRRVRKNGAKSRNLNLLRRKMRLEKEERKREDQERQDHRCSSKTTNHIRA